MKQFTVMVLVEVPDSFGGVMTDETGAEIPVQSALESYPEVMIDVKNIGAQEII